MREASGLRQAAACALLAAMPLCCAPPAFAVDPVALTLKPSPELLSVPSLPVDIRATGADQGLELRASRELAAPPPTVEPAPQASHAPAPGSELSILIALATFLFATIAALVVSSLVARWTRETREAHEERFRKRWAPALYERMAGEPVPLPPLAPDEEFMLLKLWLHLLGYVRGEAGDGLVEVANELDLPNRALLLLQSRARHERLVAMRVASALRLAEAIAPLQEKAAQARPHSSLEAASALLNISPEHGLAALRDLLGRIDWAPGMLADLLKPSGEGATAMLADLLVTMPHGSGTPILRLIGLLDDFSSVPVLRQRLQGNGDDQEIAVILQALGKLGGEEERSAAIGFLAHPGWLVRMQAAASLGELGLREDWKRLLPLIGDSHWWVRYRAARSLFKLGGAEALAAARAAVRDPYANDMLDRVQAEC